MQDRLRTRRLVAEPRGPTFCNLLSAAAGACDIAQLVVRSDLPFSDNAQSALQGLGSFLVSEKYANEWPGTRLMKASGRICSYSIRDGFAQTLMRYSSGVYDWTQPLLPEDLSFWRHGAPWFFAIAHERECFFSLSDEEATQLRSRYPDLDVVSR